MNLKSLTNLTGIIHYSFKTFNLILGLFLKIYSFSLNADIETRVGGGSIAMGNMISLVGEVAVSNENIANSDSA